ncbi:MAG: hypothetical protein Satyrvirus4_1 [Satyrvirus sp.]|uniref:Uncharacterized protein n=1 Tax=Satyrvirus sp. TaxID=2487771 RepID=A0A3G5AEU5_9VIRU|nr:MAG: hypothetical protein Satyrvirus4_1 [Satyrvirus sp.]
MDPIYENFTTYTKGLIEKIWKNEDNHSQILEYLVQHQFEKIPRMYLIDLCLLLFEITYTDHKFDYLYKAAKLGSQDAIDILVSLANEEKFKYQDYCEQYLKLLKIKVD